MFSGKIYDAFNPYNFKGLQFVPTIIRDKKDQEFDGFYIANVYQKISSFDPEKAIYKRISKLTGAWDGISKIVFDRERLAKIPLEDRLVYVAGEHPKFVLYHKTIIDVIMATTPDGLIITPVEEWYNGIDFD